MIHKGWAVAAMEMSCSNCPFWEGQWVRNPSCCLSESTTALRLMTLFWGHRSLQVVLEHCPGAKAGSWGWVRYSLLLWATLAHVLPICLANLSCHCSAFIQSSHPCLLTSLSFSHRWELLLLSEGSHHLFRPCSLIHLLHILSYLGKTLSDHTDAMK